MSVVVMILNNFSFRQMSAAAAWSRTAALHHHRLELQEGSQKPVVET